MTPKTSITPQSRVFLIDGLQPNFAAHQQGCKPLDTMPTMDTAYIDLQVYRARPHDVADEVVVLGRCMWQVYVVLDMCM